MIFSVHMPKCGGISFKHLLKSQYPKSFIEDYDFPIHDSEEERHRKAKRDRTWNKISSRFLFRYSAVDCIHGHFLPFKYEYFYEAGNHTFVTWLRDPIARLESHYHFWKQYHWKLDKLPLLKRFLDEDWSLEKFAFAEEVRNIYSLFLWNFPIERFDFVGVTEFFDEDLVFFAENFLGMPTVEIPKKNVNLKRKEGKIKDPGLIRELREFHAEDYKLYEYALERRSER